MTGVAARPLALQPQHRRALRGLPSAAELYRTLDALSSGGGAVVDREFFFAVATSSPYYTRAQLGHILSSAAGASWPEQELSVVKFVHHLKKRAANIAEHFGGLAHAPQSIMIGFFLGEAVRASRRWATIRRVKLKQAGFDDEATGETYELSSSLLGAAETAALMQACLASPLKDRQVSGVDDHANATHK